MKVRRFILSLLLNERQRQIIWQALQFSAHTYKRRHNPEGFATVCQVMNEIEPKMFKEKKRWTREEVERLIEESSELVSHKVDKIAKEAYNKGLRQGRSEAVKQRTVEDMHGIATPLRPFPFGEVHHIVVKNGKAYADGELLPGMTFNKETCEDCENKDDCGLYQEVLKDEFNSEKEEAAEGEKTSEKAEETASEAQNNEHQPEGEAKSE